MIPFSFRRASRAAPRLAMPLYLSVAVLAGAGSADTAQAQAAASPQATARHPYAIEPGPLGGVLASVAATSGAFIAAPPELVQGRSSRGVRGELDTAAALAAALAGTGLIAQPGVQGQYRLVPQPGPAVASLAPVTVTGSTLDGSLPPVYAGGQVAEGGRIGMLGNRDNLSTPFSTTQYTAQRIEQTQAQNIGDVLMDDPSVRNTYARGSGRDEFNIRGLSLFNYDVSFNGLYGISPRNSSALIGVERVEVLRGPSALLHGMAPYGSVGGAINLVPKRAGLEPLNRLTASFISDSQAGLHADIGRRFGDQAQTGVRLNALRRTGDLTVAGGSERLSALALGVDHQADRWRIEADLNYQDRVTHGRSGLLFPPEAGVPIGPAPDARSNIFPDWSYWKSREWAGVVRAELDIAADWTAYAALGTRTYDFRSLQTTWLMVDGDGTLASIPAALDESIATITAEAGLRGRWQTGPITHQPVLSTSILDIEHDQARVRGSRVASHLYRPAALIAPTLSVGRPLPKVSETRLHSVALADTLSWADDRVQATVGLRHQSVKAASFQPTSGARIANYDKSAVTPAVGLLLRPTQAWSVYANYIEGLSQGPTAPADASNAGEVFAPSISRQAELGTKLDLGRVAATVSVFQITTPSSYLDPAALRFAADGRQRNRGIEMLVQGEAARGVRLLGGVAVTHGRLTRTQQGRNDGNVAPAVPRYQFNAAAEWDTPLLAGLTLTTRLLRTSRQYVDMANTQQIPGWTRVDVGARYAFSLGDRPVVVRATVENVFDRNYWQSAAREGLTVGGPRTVLVSASTAF